MPSIQVKTVFELDETSLQKVLQHQGGPVFEAARRAGASVRDRAKILLTAHNLVNTGQLRNSIEYTVQDEGKQIVAKIEARLPYALYVHEGTTGPIVPRTARVLRFRGRGGAFQFAPQVKGTRETGRFFPFLREAIDQFDITDMT